MKIQIKRSQIPVLFLLAGLLFLTLKVPVTIGTIYPDYHMATGYKDPGWEFQYNTLDLHYGCDYDLLSVGEDGIKYVSGLHWSGYRLDLFHDVLGYILLVIGMIGLRENWIRNHDFICHDSMTERVKQVYPERKLMIAIGGSFVAILLQIALFALPFLQGGADLCYNSFFIGILSGAAEIFVSYHVIAALTARFWETSFRRDRMYLLSFWFFYVIIQIVVSFCDWSHVPSMVTLYSIIEVGACLFLVVRIFMRRNFLVRGSIEE